MEAGDRQMRNRKDWDKKLPLINSSEDLKKFLKEGIGYGGKTYYEPVDISKKPPKVSTSFWFKISNLFSR